MGNSPRLPYLKREDMTDAQKGFYDDVVGNMGDPDLPHIWMLEDGQINGPFTSMFHYPRIGYPLYRLQLEIIKQDIIAKDVFELFILVIVADARAAYGMYAHELLAAMNGVEKETIELIRLGKRPKIEKPEAKAAYELALALTKPGPVAQGVYENAVEIFGEKGYNVLINTAAFFKYIATLMNAYDEPVPQQARADGRDQGIRNC
ncbi:MAG: hypothetical protein LBS32_07755 [Clostridiales Family XIII bacterium]|jgi:4-carboxymuconolactone decarboxylase|nr:hypothetical protein [Clostridiales Family XIII bacterium]